MSWVITGVSTDILLTLGAALGGAMVLLYVLRVRRRKVEVPFSPLWAEVLRERKASKWWDRVKRLLSLLLQLLMLGAILLALGDPRTDDTLQEGRTIILLIDASASMAALDEEGGRTRIERAQQRALEVVDHVGPRDAVMVVRVGHSVKPLTPFTNDVTALAASINDIEQGATNAAFDEAFAFATSSLSGRTRPHLVVITDAAGAFVPPAALPSNVTLHRERVGRSSENVGITAFNVRRYPSNRTNAEVFTQVENFSDAHATVRLSIRGDARVLARETFDLPPGATNTLILPEIVASGDALRAEVEVIAGDVVDVFALDDVAFARLPDARPLRVLAVTDGNLYLEAPLLLNASLDVTVITPEQYTGANDRDPSEGFDATIFDGVSPPTSDVGHFLYIAPTGPFSPWSVGEERENPIITTTRSGHPLLRWISALRDVNIGSALRLELGEDDVAVVSAVGSGPMIIARTTPGSRRLALAFAIERSDFPLRVAWPVFLLNALDWFTADDASLIESFATGETWFVPLGDRQLEEVTVTSPSGRTSVVPAQSGHVAVYGDEVGFWTLSNGDRQWVVAGNLSDPDESSIAPGDWEADDDDEPLADASLTFAWDPWMLLVGFVLLVLLVEWLTWSRRWTV
ncbi:MAG: hypothetical protein ACI81R_002406 [Bradymonadia bacterium]|jgi:hypothetical protein